MFIQVDHKRLLIYEVSKELVLLCYKSTKNFPPDERFGLTGQIRRASTSTVLNIAEGCSRKSPTERKRFFEVARGSVVEIDAAFDLAVSLSFTTKESLFETGECLIQCYKLLSGLILKT